MAQWRALLKLDPELKSRVSRIYYERKIPIEIRRSFCVWIEEQDWEVAAADEAKAMTYFQSLLQKVDKLIKESLYNNHTLEGPDFSPLKEHLKNQFEHHPMEMAKKLCDCLKEEKMILDSCLVDQCCNTTVTDLTQTDLDNEVNELKCLTKHIEEEMKALEKEESIYKTWERPVKELNGLANHQLQQQCLNQENSIKTKKQALVDQLTRSVNLAAHIVQTLVSEELPEWKRRQQMSCIGNPVSACLDPLEKRFTFVGEMLLQIVQQLMKLQNNGMSHMTDVLQPIYTYTAALLNELLKNSLVVEKQPGMFSQPHRPLVLRTKVLFTLKLRFLVNLPVLKNGFSIRAEFDKDVEEVHTIKGFRQFLFTKKSYRTKVLDVDDDSGRLEGEWIMEIMEDKTKEKRSNKTPIRVTEELHIIKFSTDLHFAALQCHVETSSLPVVVVSTTTQCPSAWATVMWYNLLSVSPSTSLSMFLKPPALSWKQLSQALSWQFISAGDKELNEDQLHELKLKITDDPNEQVHWPKFSNQKEGPWIWIDGILDLIEKHLKDLWRDGSIMGFVNKEKARSLLQSKASGNFLLRFSESNRDGAISFSLVEHRKQANVRYIDPFSKEELSRMSLADHINHFREKGKSLSPLIYLYPDRPKDEVFGRYYSKTECSQPIAPYVRRTYVCEGESSTPSSPPDHEDFNLEPDQDLMDIPTPQLFPDLYEDVLLSSVCLNHTDNMDFSESF